MYSFHFTVFVSKKANVKLKCVNYVKRRTGQVELY
jgi:hypothetical protein